MSDFTILHRDQIAEDHWDSLVSKYGGGLPYAYSWYLDIVCQEQWFGMRHKDHPNWIMPLPFRRKMGWLPEIFQPPFTQQLGIIAQKNEKADFLRVLHHLETHYPSVYFHTNYQQEELEAKRLQSWNVLWHNNFTIDLQQDYSTIRRAYSKSVKHQINKNKAKVEIEPSADINSFIQHLEEVLAHKIKKPAQKIPFLKQLIEYCLPNNLGELFLIHSTTESKIIAGAFYLKTDSRLIQLANFNSATGRKLSAQHLMIDRQLKKNANRNMVYDFEGSEIQGVADFFQSFGSVNQPFQTCQLKTLMDSPIVKWLFGR